MRGGRRSDGGAVESGNKAEKSVNTIGSIETIRTSIDLSVAKLALH